MNIIFNTLNTLLQDLFNLTGDWGIAIILLTILIRAALLPMSIKQKLYMVQQQSLSEKIARLKEKYKNNKSKLESEMQKYYRQSTKGMLGCLVSLLQLPVISSLYFVIIRMHAEVGTIIIPWMVNIKMPDNYFIIPLLYVLISLGPSLLSYIEYFKTTGQAKITKSNLILVGTFSLILTVKAPAAVGIYFITSSIFSLFEEIGFRLYMKNRLAN